MTKISDLLTELVLSSVEEVVELNELPNLPLHYLYSNVVMSQ